MLIALRHLYLLLYIVVAAQGIFYWLGAAQALQHISLEAFIEQRKAIDLAIGTSLRLLYFTSLLLSILLLWLYRNQSKSWCFALLFFSFLCLSADLWLAVTRSMPLNELFNRHITGSNILPGYSEARTEWLYCIRLRGALIFAGLLGLLASMRE